MKSEILRVGLIWCAGILSVSVVSQGCAPPSAPKREIMAAYQKHRDFIRKVYEIHSSSTSTREYDERVEREQIYRNYKALVLELRRVKNENLGKLTPEEAREVEKEGEEVNKAYLRMAGEGIKLTQKPEWF